jgi:hypothetical protein
VRRRACGDGLAQLGATLSEAHADISSQTSGQRLGRCRHFRCGDATGEIGPAGILPGRDQGVGFTVKVVPEGALPELALAAGPGVSVGLLLGDGGLTLCRR